MGATPAVCPRRGKGKEGGNVKSRNLQGNDTLINSEVGTAVALRNQADVGTSSPPVSLAGETLAWGSGQRPPGPTGGEFRSQVSAPGSCLEDGLTLHTLILWSGGTVP